MSTISRFCPSLHFCGYTLTTLLPHLLCYTLATHFGTPLLHFCYTSLGNTLATHFCTLLLHFCCTSLGTLMPHFCRTLGSLLPHFLCYALGMRIFVHPDHTPFGKLRVHSDHTSSATLFLCSGYTSLATHLCCTPSPGVAPPYGVCCGRNPAWGTGWQRSGNGYRSSGTGR